MNKALVYQRSACPKNSTFRKKASLTQLTGVAGLEKIVSPLTQTECSQHFAEVIG
ncbi:MAG TPA: hypothetical protein PK299_01535 [Anaerolineales bacterium]|nr:hypothetical protein [Anaerolineales bacterium]